MLTYINLMMILKPTQKEDLEQLFLNQADEKAVKMAAFTSENPSDKDAYMEKWSKIIENPAINIQSIFVDDVLVGSVLHFDMMDETNVSYGIERKHWGNGYAKEALHMFLQGVEKRPLYGRVAFDNVGSQKVLEYNGFKKVGTDQFFANARKQEIEEWIYRLD